MERRQFLMALAASGALAMCPGLALAKVSAGSAPVNRVKRLVWLSLRGGMDGLNVVVPVGDRHYAQLRPSLALANNELLPLDNFFALNASLPVLHTWFTDRQLAWVHACATPYRDRSHFDGQKVMENGTADPFFATGWLNRLLLLDRQRQGIAIDAGLPLIMQGEAQPLSWYPNRLKLRDRQARLIGQMLVADEQLASNFAQAIKVEQMAGSAKLNREFTALAAKAGEFLSQPGGANIAALELGGWDTHADQAGRLKRQLQLLDEGLAALKTSLGEHWQDTVVIAASEFGRTAAQNGTKGTDHGTANVVLLAGGAVNGGQVLADWPGLGAAELYQGRDLAPTTDLRAVIKGVLAAHLGLGLAELQQVFPGSESIVPLPGLVRRSSVENTPQHLLT
ncbi:DUF1501 domain-containing protein [Shewanella sp. GXUN23E]|uniref:DUF1501 domain-containing protein n=1 Tax=Shewanella sp. GXUN23E TaxID=3422498 RepID=UPI003D7CC1D9